MRIDAIGYIRTDVAGLQQPWNESEIRSLAKRLGYNLRKTVTFSAQTDKPVYRLKVILERLGTVEAVFTPSVAHFDGEIPAELVQVADVITVHPEQTFARWSAGELPDLSSAGKEAHTRR
ncbi:hypothetical protein VMT65_05715 [Nocardia sp. CDC153]|uniref:hypothetical protein n=1 Tax=Nocardia sp. CDC153 TaxID=3112167 RepID=UPI002DBE6418|nr:hypothetical protein [Nocardia sp. CDC153]MEC3952522.1 hypothetical protein [Nocardia sp. CDC153]